MRDVTILDYIGNAKELTAEGGRRRMTREEAQSVIMTEQKCVDRANCNRDCANCDLVMDDAVINEALSMAIKALEPPEITDEQAIEHLQASGWMQNHDREIYESGLKERLADDSGDYDSLIPCEDTISRQAAIDTVKKHYRVDNDLLEVIVYELEKLPSAQPEKRTEERTETHTCDCISRKDAIRWIKTECNPYGKPTLDFESGKRVMKHLEQMPPAQPELKWIPCSKQLPKQGQEAICQCRANIIKVLKLDAYGDWYQDADHCYMGGFVIAWMPLPEPYEEGGADGQ